MSDGTLSQRLAAARARGFVGRTAELDLFHQGLGSAPGCDPDDEPPFSLIWVHGPGGVGKSTLLQRFADEARAGGVPVVQLDARTVPPTPNGLRTALAELPVAPAGGRTVLTVDTAELLTGVDDWVREQLLPGLPDRTLVVWASRHGPGPRWRSDLGWAEQLRSLSLGDLDRAAAGSLLTARGVPPAQVDAVVDVTHGHPLALALVADVLTQRPAGTDAPLTFADLTAVLPELLERFVDEVPDPVHRKALHVFGHARVTTEPLLRAIVGEAAAECHTWLRTLSFSQVWSSGRISGLLPHDLARDVLDGDLRVRDPDGWAELHHSVRGFYLERMRTTTGAEQARAVSDLLWFHRGSPALTAYGSWDAAFSLWTTPARASDLSAILELVARHEGPASVHLHEQWWQHQPDAFAVVRDRPGALRGFVVQLRLNDGEDLALAEQLADPFATAALRHVARAAPLRPGQHLRLVRSWIGDDGYYRPTPVHQAVMGYLTRSWLAEQGLAVAVAYSAEEPLWTPMFAHVDYARVPDAEVEHEGRRFAAYLHDWRVTSITEWLELLEGREGATGSGDVEQSLAFAQRHLTPAAPTLTEAQFATAVREAFRWATRPHALATNPLVATTVVVTADGRPDGAAAGRQLRSALEDEVARLGQDPRREHLARALTVTYLTPAATQEAAAARLSLPFSTYRRHLTTALAEVTQALWRREIDG